MRQFWLMGSIAVLAGCGGGGGGGGGASGGGGGGGGSTAIPFTSWDDIGPNKTLSADGTGEYVTWGGSGGVLTSLSGGTRTVSSWEGSYDANGSLVALKINVGNTGSTVVFDRGSGDTLARVQSGPLQGYASVALKANGDAIGIAAEPAPVGWKYQSYGVWVTGLLNTSGTVAAASIGNRTPTASVPAAGKALFTGTAGGFYSDPAGNIYLTAADMVAVADFGQREIVLSTLNTSRSSDLVNFVDSPQLDLSGRGTINTQSSLGQFDGILFSRQAMSGNYLGGFYGPSASEIGGTYTVRGSGTEAMIGGFGGRSDPIVSFTTWQNLPLNRIVQASGISTRALYTGTTSATTSISNFETSGSYPATYTALYDGNGNASLVMLQSGDTTPTTVAFNRNVGDTLATATVGPAAGRVSYALKADGTAAAVAAEPIPQGWDYQTYGVWATGYPQSGSGSFGAMSVGNATAAAAIPSSGSATFTGSSGGLYTNSAGTPNFIVSDMTANVNFGTRQIALNTSNTNVVTNNFTTFTPNNQLDINGTLQITAGENRFSGFAATRGNTLTGLATGQFYGPNASEIGGTYGLKGNGLESIVGGFGGKR